MSAPSSYRGRRKRRLRVIAAIVVISLAAPPVLVALQALKGFGAGMTLLVLAVAAILGYRALARRDSPGGDR